MNRRADANQDTRGRNAEGEAERTPTVRGNERGEKEGEGEEREREKWRSTQPNVEGSRAHVLEA